MYVSPTDPLNSVNAWFTARTYQAVRQQDWTPEADLHADYLRYAERLGVPVRKRLGKIAFSAELAGLMRRQPQLRSAREVNSGPDQLLPFWPRVLRNARLLKAA
jgi:hypothetical protein